MRFWELLLEDQAAAPKKVGREFNHLEDLVFKFAEVADKSVTIEEITENIFILITENKNKLNTNVLWKDTIIPNIHAISKLRKTDAVKYQSMTTRSTFKFMDIIDAIKC